MLVFAFLLLSKWNKRLNFVAYKYCVGLTRTVK